MVGDWDTTFHHFDKTGGLPRRETANRNGLLSLMKELNLVEVYRRLQNHIPMNLKIKNGSPEQISL